MLKIIFKNKKIYYFNIFLNKKYFKKKYNYTLQYNLTKLQKYYNMNYRITFYRLDSLVILFYCIHVS